jgi:hypothetical protein
MDTVFRAVARLEFVKSRLPSLGYHDRDRQQIWAV